MRQAKFLLPVAQILFPENVSLEKPDLFSFIFAVSLSLFKKYKRMKTSKIALLALLFAVTPMLASAQKTLAQRMADDFCIELDKQNIPDKWDESSMEKIGMAMMPLAAKYADEFKKEYGIELNTQKDFEEFGRVIGEEAGRSCPKFKKMMEDMVGSKVEEAQSTSSLDGTFSGLDTSGSFATLKVKDAEGREQKIWWFENFSGAELLTKKPEGLAGKKVTVVYVEREVYEPRLKDYVKIKVAAGLKLN